MVPVTWELGWPIVGPGVGRVEFVHAAPDLPEQPWPARPTCDNFETDRLALCRNFLRTPREQFWSLQARPGYLRLRLRPQRLSELSNPSFIGQRQRHIDFNLRTCMDFSPQGANECAGVVLLQNNDFHFRFVVTQDKKGSDLLRLIQRREGKETELAKRAVSGSSSYFKVTAKGQDYSFYFSSTPDAWEPIASQVKGHILRTPVAGGFVGAYMGMYASSNGEPSENVADFDWFEYVGVERI